MAEGVREDLARLAVFLRMREAVREALDDAVNRLAAAMLDGERVRIVAEVTPVAEAPQPPLAPGTQLVPGSLRVTGAGAWPSSHAYVEAHGERSENNSP